LSGKVQGDFASTAFAISFRNSLVCAAQENFFAVCQALAAMAPRSEEFDASMRIASLSSRAFSGSFRITESSAFTSQSLTPARELTTTGSPHDMASSTGKLKE